MDRRRLRVDQLDVTRPDQVREVLRRERPAVVIHAAAYTAVDAAESDVATAEAVNARGTAHVAEAAREVGARLLHVSTDFVFDGASGRPYAPDDLPQPLGVYGRTKLAAEGEARRALGDRAVILRTAWVYSRHGQNFVRTMLRLMQEREEVGVVADQIGTPTWADSLADALWAAAIRPVAGVLHWTDAGVASWYDFAVAIQEEALAAGLLPRAVPIRPLRTERVSGGRAAPALQRPRQERHLGALGRTPPHWRVNLRRMLQELARG